MAGGALMARSVCPGVGQLPTVVENGMDRQKRIVPKRGDCPVCGGTFALIRAKEHGHRQVYVLRHHTVRGQSAP